MINCARCQKPILDDNHRGAAINANAYDWDCWEIVCQEVRDNEAAYARTQIDYSDMLGDTE
jgi:hypothetical protein